MSMEKESINKAKAEIIKNAKCVAKFSYEHNDGDQCWNDTTTFFKTEDNRFVEEYEEGYYGTKNLRIVSYEEISEKMNKIRNEIAERKKMVTEYGYDHPFTRGGYCILFDGFSTDNLLKEVEKLNNNTPNGVIQDADTILADIMSDCDWEIPGLATEVFETYKKSHDKQAVKNVFYALTGKEFDEFLKICTEHITKKNHEAEEIRNEDAKLLHVHTLINLGFVPEDGPRGEKGYTRTIHHMKNETLWITVSLQNNKVYLYNEWDCGGMLWDKTIDVPSEVLNSKDTFMIWLNKQI